MKRMIPLILALAVTACGRQAAPPQDYTTEVMNRYTPVKDQGQSQTCWAYAMLAAIETEHIMRGDSVNLSPAYVEKMLEREPAAPKNKRGMGQTLINMIQKYGIVAYDAMRTPETPVPIRVFMLGAEYTPLEFAHSVCAPGEYIALTSTSRKPYGQEVEVDAPDNWEHNRFYNIPMDTLLQRTVRAVREGHGVCWESKAHAMAIVGLARDKSGKRYFVMKNSWGDRDEYKGLVYLSFTTFRRQTLAIYMTRDIFSAP